MRATQTTRLKSKRARPDPPIAETAIKRQTDAKVFERGEDYFANGMIVGAVRIGQTLTARCRGGDVEPYRLKVVFGKQRVTEAICTCPYDWGGYCKHIVALLLTHVRAPEKILTKAAVKAALADRKRDDLIMLITQMIDYEPDLYGLIDGSGLPAPGEFDAADEEW